MDSSVIVKIVVVLLYSVALPIGLVLWWKKKTGESSWCFVAGALIFFVFVDILESSLHSLILSSDSGISRAILSSAVLYTLYVCLVSGVFEETGRLVGFRVLLKDHAEKECPVAYGIGHGGMEVLLVVGATYLVYLMYALGGSSGNEATDLVISDTLNSLTWGMVFVAMAERISAMMIHIGLSMIVFTACRQEGKMGLYGAAVGLHALSNVPSALYQYKVISSLAFVEIAAFISGILLLLLGIYLLSQSEPKAGNPSSSRQGTVKKGGGNKGQKQKQQSK